MLAIEHSRALGNLIAAGMPRDDAASAIDRMKPAATYEGARYYSPKAIGRAFDRWQAKARWHCDTFAEYAARRDAAQRESKAASDAIRSIPGVGSGALGLTPDNVKQSPEFKAAAARYGAASVALQELNKANAKRFARELRAEREARRAAKLAALSGELSPAPIG